MNNKMITKKYSILLLLVMMLTSCDFLDFDESTGYANEEDMYAYFSRSETMLTNVYSYLDQDFGSINGAMRDCATDDAHYVWSNNSVHTFTNGSWSAINTVDNYWYYYYYGIRAANRFVNQISAADYSRFEWNNDYTAWKEKSQYWKYEAQFLRAQFHFELARRYGDIPLADKVFTVEEVNSLTKTSFDDVIAYIITECDSAIAKLPESYTDVNGKETGRITKGAAMALKARALLYAASPLHNASNDVEKWKSAAKASQAIIDASLYQIASPGKLNEHTLTSKDMILERRNGTSNGFEKLNFPVGYAGGNTGTCPTQNLVDAFQNLNGYDVKLTATGWECDDSLFDPTQPYANRDPRFEATVLFNTATWKGETIEPFSGGRNGFPIVGASETGYYLRKLLLESVEISVNEKVSNHYWPLYRYAEVVLNHAEAMNEAFPSPEYTDATYPTSALVAINKVRMAAFMLPIPAGKTQAEMREIIRRERRVELAFENHRFWDVRRWKIGATTQKDIKGVTVVDNQDGTFDYSLKSVESRVWDEKMNLYPISIREIYINENLKPQNPGW